MSPTTNTFETVTTLETEEAKLQRIEHAITLKSCKGNVKEQQNRINYLRKIYDDKVLDYVLSVYAEPFDDYMAGIEPRYKPTALDINGFFRRVGASDTPLLNWCLDKFCIPDKAEEEE